MATGAWQLRTLNTKVADTAGICTLSANQFTLPAGTYVINATVPTFWTNESQGRLYNVTDSSVAIVGRSEYAAVSTVVVQCGINGIVTIAGTKTFQLEHRVSRTQSGNGAGIPVGGGGSFTPAHELYSQIQIWKLS
jgi:hypothetical protein